MRLGVQGSRKILCWLGAAAMGTLCVFSAPQRGSAAPRLGLPDLIRKISSKANLVCLISPRALPALSAQVAARGRAGQYVYKAVSPSMERRAVSGKATPIVFAASVSGPRARQRILSIARDRCDAFLPPTPPAPSPTPVIPQPVPPACSDGLDNDGDGFVDYPADAGCQDASSDQENGEEALRQGQYASTWFSQRPPEDTQRLLYSPAAAASTHYQIQQIATEIMSRPTGHRAVMFHDLAASFPALGYTNIREDPRDFSADPMTGQRYVTLWWDQGAASLAARLRSWLLDFRSRGGVLDEVIFDYEEYYPFSWGIQQCSGDAYYFFVGCSDLSPRFRAIENDPRFFESVLPELESRGFVIQGSLENTLSHRSVFNQPGDPWLIWDSVVSELYSAAINRALFEPVHEVFPNAKVSNYGYHNTGPAFQIPDAYGNNFFLYSSGLQMGNTQAPVLYGDLTSNFLRFATTPLSYAVTPFNAARADINRLRASVLSDPRPVTPWIAPREFSGNYRNSPFYQEMLFHTLLSGADHFIYWNPYGQLESDRLLDRTLLEFEKVAGFEGRASLETNILSWQDSVIVSCAETLTRRICRVTADPALGDTRQLLNSTPSGPEISASDYRLQFPGGSVVTVNGSTSPAGVWIAMPTGNSPQRARR